MKPSGLSPRDRRALLLGTAALALALAVRFGLVPYVRAVADAHEALAREQRLLRQEQTVLARTDAYSERVERLAAGIATFAPRLLPADRTESAHAILAEAVTSAAENAPALVRRTQPLPARSVGAGLRAVSLRVAGESDLEGILTVVARLESHRRLLRIDDVSVEVATDTRTGSGRGVRALGFSFTVTGYMVPDAPAAAAGPGRAGRVSAAHR